MKKALIIFLSVAAFLAILFFVGRNYILPAIIAKSVASGEAPPEFLPDKMEKTVEVIQDNVNQQVEQLPIIMKELNLDFDDLIFIVDNVKADEVMNTIDEINASNVSSVDQAYDIAVQNVHIEGYDLEVFRPFVKEKLTLKKMNRALHAIEENKLQTSISIPVARNTAKRILMDNRTRIEKALSEINGG